MSAHDEDTRGAQYACDADTFKKWANQLSETAISQHLVKHPVRTVPAPFCSMRYINDGRYLTGYGATENEILVAVWQNIMEFYEKRGPDITLDFQSHHILAIRTLINVECAKEL